MKQFLMTLVLAACINTLFGQQRTSYTQYSNILTPVNPAASFLRPEGEVSLIGRRHRVGGEGAPKALWMTASLPVFKENISAGFIIRHESLAIETNTEIVAFGGVSVPLSSTDRLAFTFGAGAAFYNGDFASLNAGEDPVFKNNLKKTEGLLTIGLLYFRPEKFYAGLSIPRLAFSKIAYNETAPSQTDMSNQYHFTGGMLFSVSEDLHVKTAAIASYARNLGMQARLSPMLIVKRTFGLGADGSTEGDLAGMAVIHTGAFSIGYSYQFYVGNKPLSRTINNQTHELTFSYRFGKGTLKLL